MKTQITEELKKILLTYKEDSRFRVQSRKSGEDDYFLISVDSYVDFGFEFTIIWIGENVWQYRYCNPSCMTTDHYVELKDLLEKLKNKTFLKQ